MALSLACGMDRSCTDFSVGSEQDPAGPSLDEATGLLTFYLSLEYAVLLACCFKGKGHAMF
jgi:hypothetical protein